MEYAVQLMKQHPEYTLGAISEACGIKSPATFIRNFKNTFGMTPSEFQKNMSELPAPTDFWQNEKRFGQIENQLTEKHRKMTYL